jgi:WD40 repeat protein
MGELTEIKEGTPVKFEYDLFISYSTDPDYQLSRRIESFLESFHKIKFPEGVKLKSLAVCRDGSDFSLHAIKKKAMQHHEKDYVNLVLEHYLQKSQYLLVLCSRNAALSSYVRFEIAWFLKNKGADYILLAVSEGNNFKEEKLEIFPADILKHNLQTKPFYDLRGFRKESKTWNTVRNHREELINLAAFLNDQTSGKILPLWRTEEVKKLKRQRLLIGAAALVLLIVALLAIFQRSDAIRQRRNVQNQLALTYWSNSQVARDRGDLIYSQHLAAEAVNFFENTAQTRNVLLDNQISLASARLQMIVPLISSSRFISFSANTLFPLSPFIFSPDDRLIASTSDSLIRLFDVESGRQTDSLHQKSYYQAIFSPDGQHLLSTDSTGFHIWAVKSLKRESLFIKYTGNLEKVSYNNNGNFIMVRENSAFYVYDSNTGEQIKLISDIEDSVLFDVAFLPEKDEILALSGKNIVYWDLLQQGKAISRTSLLPAFATTRRAKFSPDCKSIITQDSHDHMLLYNLESGKLIDSLAYTPVSISYKDYNADIEQEMVWGDPNSKSAEFASFSSNSQIVLTRNAEGIYDVWEANTGRKLNTIKNKTQVTFIYRSTDYIGANINPDGSLILTTDIEKAQLWDAKTGDPVAFLFHDDLVGLASFSPSGKFAVTVSKRAAKIWAVKAASPGNHVATPEISSMEPSFSSNSKLILIEGKKYIHMLDIGTMKERVDSAFLKKISGDVGMISHDEKFFFAVNDSFLKVWDITSHKLIDSIRGDYYDCELFFNSAAKQLLIKRTLYRDSTVDLYDLLFRNRVRSIKNDELIFDATFSNEGAYIQTIGTNLIRYWDAKTLKPVKSVRLNIDLDFFSRSPQQGVKKVGFSPGGTRFYTAKKNIVSVYDSETGKKLGLFKLENEFYRGCLDSSGGWLLTLTRDRVAQLWNVDAGKKIGDSFKNIKNIAISPDGSHIMILDDESRLKFFKIAGDLDISPELFGLQVTVFTGAELDSRTSDLKNLSFQRWELLKHEYYIKGEIHSKACKYLAQNQWLDYFKKQ